jgi:RNA polymerase sigma-70 factor (ECF subfamily)
MGAGAKGLCDHMISPPWLPGTPCATIPAGITYPSGPVVPLDPGRTKRRSRIVNESHDTQRLAQEATWVAQALSGDARGFDSLMRRYHGPLRRLLRAMLHNDSDAEDILQETFLRSYRFLHRFDPERPFGPWLMRIGANLARNCLKRRATRVEVPLDAADSEEDETFEGEWMADPRAFSEVEHRELIARTRKAMESLPEEQRVVVEMRILGEMSYREIAAALDIPIGTVMSRLNRGRRQIQAVLADLAPPAPQQQDSSRLAAPEVS